MSPHERVILNVEGMPYLIRFFCRIKCGAPNGRYTNWKDRGKTCLLPVRYVWEIRPVLLGRSYLILRVTDHRSPITDHQSPTVLTSLFLRIYYISFEKRLHFDFFSFAIYIDFAIKMKK